MWLAQGFSSRRIQSSSVSRNPKEIQVSPKEVLEFAEKNDAKQLDLRFTDIPGLQHHVSYPMAEVDESSFEEGFGMDGSSIRGWAAIHESDMLLIPDPETAIMDPFAETPTLVMIGERQGPGHQAALRARPALDRPEGRALPEEQRHCRHRLFRRGSRVLHFRQRQLRSEPARRVTTSSTPRKGAGIPAGGRTTWATGRATRKATSRCRPRTITRICAARWCRP